MQAVGLIRDEFDYREGPIFSHITGAVSTADMLVKRLEQIREAHNASGHIQVTLTEHEANLAESSISAVEALFLQAASTFDLLDYALELDDSMPLRAAMPSTIEFARRAMLSASEREGKESSRLAQKIRGARFYNKFTEEKAE